MAYTNKSFGVVEGLQTLPEKSAMVREWATPYARGLKVPSYRRAAKVLKASSQTPIAVRNYTPKQYRRDMRICNWCLAAPVVVGIILIWIIA